MDKSNQGETRTHQRTSTTRDEAIAELTKSRASNRAWIFGSAAIFAANIGFHAYRSLPEEAAMSLAIDFGLIAFLAFSAVVENGILRRQLKAVVACLMADQSPGHPAQRGRSDKPNRV